MTADAPAVFGVFRVGDCLIGVPIDNLAEVCAVPTLSKLITPAGPILGAFDLRGNMVPLVDSLALLQAGRFEGPVSKAALIQHHGRVVAIALDEVVNLFEATVTVPSVRRGNSNPAAKEQTTVENAMFAGGFVMNGKIVSCMDVEVLLLNTSEFAVEQTRKSSRGSDTLHSSKYLVFASGGAKFAVATEHVWGTVPKCRLDRQNLSVDDGLFLGFIQHIGAKIPVIDTNMILGIGQSSRSEDAEVVALRLSDENLIGLHVDATEKVMSVRQAHKESTSALLSRNELLKEVFIESDGTQVFFVDHDVLARRTDVVSIAKLVTSSTDETIPMDRPIRIKKEERQDQSSYLVFEAGSRRAVPAKQVVRIIKTPDVIIPARKVPPEVQGFFAYGKASVPILSLAGGPLIGAAEYVLLVSHKGEQLGFLAEEICGVRSPERQYPSAKSNSDEPILLELKDDCGKRLIPLIDLEDVAASVFSCAAN